MKTCTKCGVSKPFDQFNKDAKHSDGYRCECKECRKFVTKAHYQKNRAEIIAKVSDYAAKNADKIKATKKLAREKNKDKLAEINRSYREANKEKLAESHKDWHKRNPDKRKQYNRTWIERNKSHFAALGAKYRACKYSATPDWADRQVIGFMYATRDYMTNETGFAWHVDHFVPLQGETVCGLHTHTNLRVIPAVDNLKKSNKLLIEGTVNV